MPVFHFTVPSTVEPEFVYGSILGHQLLKLIFHKPDVFIFVGILIAGFMAVPKRIIYGKCDSLFVAGIRYGAYDVYFVLDARIGDVMVGIFTVPKAEAIVVFRNKYDGAHSGIFGCLHPLCGFLRDVGRRGLR